MRLLFVRLNVLVQGISEGRKTMVIQLTAVTNPSTVRLISQCMPTGLKFIPVSHL